jgi:hypothetical protein
VPGTGAAPAAERPAQPRSAAREGHDAASRKSRPPRRACRAPCQRSLFRLCPGLPGTAGHTDPPPGEDGDARGGPGLNDTGIIGALLPIAGRGTRVLIFHVVAATLKNTEIEDLRQLNADRLTYPGTRGAIAPLLWSLYEEHLKQLHATAPPE